MSAYDVIFIDDEVSLTEIFQHFVLAKYKDWRFQAFSNANLAYSQIVDNQLTATVWIIDLMMPGKNGMEIAGAIREQNGHNPIVLAYTALDNQDLRREEGYRDGLLHFDKVVNKMEDPVSLLSQVDVLVTQGLALEPA